MPQMASRNEVGLRRGSQKCPEVGMTRYAYRSPNLFPPISKNNQKAAIKSRRVFNHTEKNFYTFPAQVENGLFSSIKTTTY
jgi:hypothetical protein